MSECDLKDGVVAIAANGGDLRRQAEAVERELRRVHERLDQVLCSVESLASSPCTDGTVVALLREAVEPAAGAIQTGAALLLERVRQARAASGW